jgi:hypothetical protein
MGSVPCVSSWRRAISAFAVAALAVFASATASAGDAVRLVVEPDPLDTTQLDAAQQISVQVVGIDAAGSRVSIREVEVSATQGRFVVVQAPYKYTYTAPADLREATRVRLRAWLRATPEVEGEIALEVLPPVPYRRLMLTGPGTTPAGTSIDLDLTGETPGGAVEAVPEGIVRVTVASGPGTITFLRRGRYRYEAPQARTGATTRIVAQLVQHTKVQTSLDVLVTAGGSGEPRPPVPQPGPNAPPSDPKPSDPKPPGGTEKPPVPKPQPPAADEDVVWPSGNIRIGTWRTKSAAEAEFSAHEKSMPKPGGEFVATKEQQKLRIVVLRTDVREITVEQWVGEKKAADVKRLEPSKDGPYRLERNKAGNQVIHFEGTTPDNGKPLNVSIVLVFNDGKSSREELVLRRDLPTKR